MCSGGCARLPAQGVSPEGAGEAWNVRTGAVGGFSGGARLWCCFRHVPMVVGPCLAGGGSASRRPQWLMRRPVQAGTLALVEALWIPRVTATRRVGFCFCLQKG